MQHTVPVQVRPRPAAQLIIHRSREGEGIKWPEKCGVVCVCLLRKDSSAAAAAGVWLPLSYIQTDLQLH